MLDMQWRLCQNKVHSRTFHYCLVYNMIVFSCISTIPYRSRYDNSDDFAGNVLVWRVP